MPEEDRWEALWLNAMGKTTVHQVKLAVNLRSIFLEIKQGLKGLLNPLWDFKELRARAKFARRVLSLEDIILFTARIEERLDLHTRFWLKHLALNFILLLLFIKHLEQEILFFW